MDEEIKEVRDGQQPKTIVLDSRAFFLRKISVEALCKDRPNAPSEEDVEFMTCNDVMSELKDEQTQLYVQSLPFDLKLENPLPSALKFVNKFAKETGDYQGLSATDLRVMALAYSIVQQRGEAKYCRKSPPELSEFKPKWSKPLPKEAKKEPEEKVVEEDDGWEIQEEKAKPKKKKWKRNVKRDFYPEAFLNNLNNQPVETSQESQQQDSEKKPTEEKTTPEDDNLGSKPTFAEKENTPEIDTEPIDANTDAKNHEQEGEDDKDDILVQKETPETNDESEEDDCDDEWITPDNLQTYLHAKDDQAQHNKNEEDDSRKISVEVVTSDFAMQNVLMQIGIPVVSLDGVEIRKIKRFKLRCDGCKTINKKVDIEFCEK